MFIIPVPFSKYYKEMLAHCKELMEYQNGYVAIHPRYNKLITALRTAVENPFTSQISKSIQPLDKEATSHDDLFDAFRMSFIWFFIKVRVVTFNTNKDAKQAVEK